MIRMTEAPLKSPMVKSDMLVTPWVQYITELQDSVQGYWGRSNLGVSTSTKNIIQLAGKTVHIYISMDEVPSDMDVTIPEAYTPLDGPIQVCTVSGGAVTSIINVLVSGGSFTIPASNDRVIVTGTLLRDLGD